MLVAKVKCQFKTHKPRDEYYPYEGTFDPNKFSKESHCTYLSHTTLTRRELNKFLWDEPNPWYKPTNGLHLTYFRQRMHRLGFVSTRFEASNRTLYMVHPQKHLELRFTASRLSEVYFGISESHSNAKLVSKHGGQRLMPIGRWMCTGTTTESPLDFRTLAELYARVRKTITAYK